MNSYYFGGYYLMKLKPIGFGSERNTIVYTCSNCINDSLLGSWAYPRVKTKNEELKSVYQDLQIDGEKFLAIRNWADNKIETESIGWVNVFADLKTVKQYKQTFFSHLEDLVIMSIYFDKNEMDDFFDEFKSGNAIQGSVGIYQNLIKKIPEDELKDELFIGFDLIGIELSGDFHSFHCHNISEELITKFNIEINPYGLLNTNSNWQPILEYMNDDATGLEPVPWFSVKIKLHNFNVVN